MHSVCFWLGQKLVSMSPYAQLAIRKKAVAVALVKEGYSTLVIAKKKISCNQSTVSRVLKLECETCDV